jgi:hypothetical protein
MTAGGALALLLVLGLGLITVWFLARSWSAWSVRASDIGNAHSPADHRAALKIADARASEVLARTGPFRRVILGPFEYLVLRKGFYLEELGRLDPPAPTSDQR